MTESGWKANEATVYSADYVDSGGEQRPFWRVTYSYRVREEYYSGEFTDFSTDSEVTYRKDDPLVIEYNLDHPGRSRVPGATTWWSKARVPFAIGLGLALLVGIVELLNRR